ncbi:MAG: Kelch repeat-containing protein, partial [Nitrososphaera sp.]
GTNEVYDPNTDTWSTLSPMPTPRAGLGVVAVGDKIFAIGGRDGTVPNSGTPLSTVEAYDIATDTWSSLTPMPTARGDVSATAAHGNKIYVAGGWSPASCGPFPDVCSTLEVYDVASDSWSTLPSMPTARSNAAAVVVGNNLFVIGGAIALIYTDFNEVFDIDKGTWSTATDKPFPCSETEAVAHGNKIYIAGCGIFGAAAGVHEAFLVNTYRRGF